MNYIVLDLEWNQCPGGRKNTESLIFEIIEIGAVKLDADKNMIDSFSAKIKPEVYKTFHVMTAYVLNRTEKDYECGEPFSKVVENFFAWCGEDYIFCSWGEMDLIELHHNLEYYHIKKYLTGTAHFYDVQKLFALQFEGKKSPKTLEYAAHFMGISEEGSFHEAYYDALCTAKILAKLDFSLVEEYYSLDYYHNPKRKKDEITIKYKTYSKYVSMEYPSKEEAMQDKDVRSTICYLCGRRTVKRMHWFASGSDQYYCLSYCKEHGYMRGKIRFKKGSNGKVFVIKILKLISQQEAETVRDKKLQIQKKRREKLKRKKETEC